MTELEKLAEEAAMRPDNPFMAAGGFETKIIIDRRFKEGFEAGFRRAREMAADIVDEDIGEGGYLIRRLGEGEVE